MRNIFVPHFGQTPWVAGLAGVLPVVKTGEYIA